MVKGVRGKQSEWRNCAPKRLLQLLKVDISFQVERIIEKITFNQNVAIVMGKELQQPEYDNEPRGMDTEEVYYVWIRSEMVGN